MKYLILGAIGTGRTALAKACLPTSLNVLTERTKAKPNSPFGTRRFAVVNASRIQANLTTNTAVLVDDYDETADDSGYESLDDVEVDENQHLVVVTHVIPSRSSLLKYDEIFIPHSKGNEMYFDHLLEVWGLPCKHNWDTLSLDTLVFTPPTFTKRNCRYRNSQHCYIHGPRPEPQSCEIDVCGL